jgi:CRP/FNR family transcriptional regulator
MDKFFIQCNLRKVISMMSTQQHETSKVMPSAELPSLPIEAGRQCRGTLWSSLRNVCELLHIPNVANLDDSGVLFHHVQFKAGQRIYTIGQTFDSLYIVNSGFLKTVSIDEFGNEQVLSFPMKGDVIGVEGISTKKYTSEAVALSECSLILLPFQNLTELGHMHAEFEHAIYSVISRELVRNQSMVSMLGVLGAEARVARFLVALSNRYAEIGYSKKSFNLRMTRQEIGSYLGLSMETVSRTLSLLSEIGLISVYQRAISINDSDLLKNLRRIPPSKSRMKKFAQTNVPMDSGWANPPPSSMVN